MGPSDGRAVADGPAVALGAADGQCHMKGGGGGVAFGPTVGVAVIGPALDVLVVGFPVVG